MPHSQAVGIDVETTGTAAVDDTLVEVAAIGSRYAGDRMHQRSWTVARGIALRGERCGEESLDR